MFQSDKPDSKISSKTSSILGPELEIHGDVKVSGSLLIYGKVFGNIQSNGAVQTANGSVVNGNISAKDVAIGGKVDGDLDVEKKVTLVYRLLLERWYLYLLHRQVGYLFLERWS